MLATLVDEPPEGEWHAEVKYDGYRAIAALSNGRLAMQTRNQLDLSERFPRIAKALQQIVVGDAVIDGEICALDPEGVPRFELLQQHNDVVLFAFDELRLAEVVKGPLPEALESVRKRGLEGLLLKAPKSVYAKGRSRDWLKLKVQ